VAYSTEDPSPAAALAACSRAAADAASHVLVALHDRALPVGAVSVAQSNYLQDAVDKAEGSSLSRQNYRTTANVSCTVNIQTPLFQRVVGTIYMK
jgi:hypothetical protein